MSTEALLNERVTTHGPYSVHARVAQRLKQMIEPEPGYLRLDDCQREALQMIFHKVGRIIAGNANFADHWDDIAGYAVLVSKEILAKGKAGEVKLQPRLEPMTTCGLTSER